MDQLYFDSDIIRSKSKNTVTELSPFIRLHRAGSHLVLLVSAALHPSFTVLAPSGLTTLSYATSCSSISQLLEDFRVKVQGRHTFISIYRGLLYRLDEIQLFYFQFRQCFNVQLSQHWLCDEQEGEREVIFVFFPS